MPTVLIVDDHAAIRAAVRILFESSSDLVVCGEAENGAEAIRKAHELQPDLVILDLSMPVMNGFEAARILRHRFPTVPLFLLTAHYMDATVEAAKEAGIQAVFSKDHDLGPLVLQAKAALTKNRTSRVNISATQSSINGRRSSDTPSAV